MLCFGLITSDASFSHAISEQLKDADAGWQFALFPSLEDALAAWSDALPSLLLWDAQTAIANQEMAEVFAQRLSQAHSAPLLLVLGAAPPAVEAFGITEAFTRPLRLGYLLTRLQFYQRVLQQSPDVSFVLGPWRFEPRKRTLVLQPGGERAKLTEKEAGLLEYLCAADHAVPRDELLASIWGYDSDIDTHTLETHIYRLRRRLMEPAPDGEDPFVMERGGYCINPRWIGKGGESNA